MAIYDNRSCKSCGVMFSGGPRSWYCPKCRVERKKITTMDYRKRKQMGNSRILGEKYHCERCGKLYTLSNGLQKYCEECAIIAHKELDNKQGIAYYHERVDKDARREKKRKYYTEHSNEINAHRRKLYAQKKQK